VPPIAALRVVAAIEADDAAEMLKMKASRAMTKPVFLFPIEILVLIFKSSKVVIEINIFMTYFRQATFMPIIK
jgi:hypothetical protein